MATNNKNAQGSFSFKGAEKLNKNFMYKDLRRSNCYDCDFSGSNFDYTSLRGAHMKSCNFFGCSFKAAEFVGTNCKKSKFKKAKFEHVVFEGVNLDGVDFNGATFKDCIFVGTDLSTAKNINIGESKVFEKMPTLEISEALQKALEEVMQNEVVKKARVLDTKEGNINAISVMRLLEVFSEETLIKGLNKLKKELGKDFCTLSYITKAIADYEAMGVI